LDAFFAVSLAEEVAILQVMQVMQVMQVVY
jgi:hypothetical protein